MCVVYFFFGEKNYAIFARLLKLGFGGAQP
jgi:hypothetical protein